MSTKISDEDTVPDGGRFGPRIVLRHREVGGGLAREYYALIYCRACGSALTSREWRPSMGDSVRAARESLAEHLASWPQCAAKEGTS